MTTPPAGPGRVGNPTPGQYGQPGGPEDVTRPVQPGSYPSAPAPTPTPTQQQPGYGGHPQPGPYQPPGQYGQAPGWPQQGAYPPFQPPGVPGPPPGAGSNKTGLVVGVVVLVLVVIGASTGWYFFLGPGAKKDPVPGSGPAVAAAPATPGDSSGGAAAAPDADKGGDVRVDVEVGQCVNLSGSDTNAAAEPVTCGSTEANYKVIGKAPTQDQCAKDVDATYFESLGATEVGALCLDVDWAKGDCFELSGLDPQRVDCRAPGGTERVKVGETIKGTSDLSRCPETGYKYDQRKFVVCFQSV